MLLYVDPVDALDYSYPILLASVISLIYSTAIYFFSKSSDDERGKVVYKGEIKAIIMNILLFSFSVLAWSGLQSLVHVSANSYIVELAGNAIEKNLVRNFPERAYNLIVKYLPSLGFFSSVSISFDYVDFKIWDYSFKAGASYSSNGISLAFQQLYEFFSNAFSHIVYLEGLKYLMLTFEFFSIKFLLPLGIFFRTFSYTRRLGSTMVAMALGAGLVLPMVVYFASDVVNSLMSSSDFLGVTELLNEASDNSLALDTYRLFAIANSYVLAYFGIISEITTYAVLLLDILGSSHIPIVSEIASAAFSGAVLTIKGGAYAVELVQIRSLTSSIGLDPLFHSPYFQYMAQALIAITIGMSIFYFIVAMTVISFIRAFSSLLGGEFFLYGVERLI